jgi:hypothetical protein
MTEVYFMRLQGREKLQPNKSIHQRKEREERRGVRCDYFWLITAKGLSVDSNCIVYVLGS